MIRTFLDPSVRAGHAEQLNVHLERSLDASTVGRVHQVLVQGGES